MGFSTDCIHAGQEPEPHTGAVTIPIYQTSTYVQPELGRHKGYEYARTQNPTRAALEGNVAAIEGGKAAFAYASGMAAIGAIATLLKSGDHVVVSDNTYGGTFRLFDKVLTRYQLSFSYVDTSDLDATERAFTPATRFSAEATASRAGSDADALLTSSSAVRPRYPRRARTRTPGRFTRTVIERKRPSSLVFVE